MGNMNDIFPPLVGFQSKKAAQIAAYFATRASGTIEKLKLIKLIYLSEREFMRLHARPMLYDELYSLKDGPICSATLNAINGVVDSEIWDEYVARNGNIVMAVKKLRRDSMTEVSNSEFQVIERIWMKFSGMTPSQVRNFTHTHCPEYREVFSGRFPITYAEVFKELGFDDYDALAARVEDFRQFESAFIPSES